jgi:hypothetical protein
MFLKVAKITTQIIVVSIARRIMCVAALVLAFKLSFVMAQSSLLSNTATDLGRKAAPKSDAQNEQKSESIESREQLSKHTFFLCSRHKEIRWLRIFSSTDGKCKTAYSKEGFMQIISSASYYASCEAVLLNVKKNIEDGGFKCRNEKLAAVIDVE